MDDKVIYLAYRDRAYRIRSEGDLARIERQAHNGHSAQPSKTYTYPYILESGRYWHFSWCERLIKRYEGDVVKDEEIARLKGVKRAAPAIQQVIVEMIKGKPNALESGYEIAKRLKQLGYTLEQVSPVVSRTCPPNIRAGIMIEFTV